MSRLVVVMVLAGVAAAGLVRLAARLVGWKRKKRFAETYLARFRALAHGAAFDAGCYDWLVARSVRIQQHLGPLGLSEPLATAYDPTPLPADPLIVATLPELRGGRPRPERLARCEEALTHYLGALDDERAGYLRQFANPFVWLGEGVRAALLLPLLALQWLGLFKESFVRRWAHSGFFNLLSGAVAVLGVAASAMIVVLGWERFTDLVAQWTATVFSYAA